ncbi:hypothetical protein [Pseudonocardia sp. GCM10023141]|uniref:hypothetical protein n=1 Tax=Pseudonocardia sp. GCM10023141 TaxID=3252653 RepID=UPI00360C671D
MATLQADEVVQRGGLWVTSAGRTVVDVARTVPFEQAVVTADAALATGKVDRAALDVALHAVVGWPGAPAARRALAFADAGAESVGESRSRVAINKAGLPPPVLQWEVRDQQGVSHWVDFGWPEFRTVGEFDGQIKYGRLLRPGEEPGDAVFREKVREDEIRATDLGMVRWIWDDLADFAPVAARLRERFRSRTS